MGVSGQATPIEVFDNLMQAIRPSVIEGYTGGLYYWDEKVHGSPASAKALGVINAHHEQAAFDGFMRSEVQELVEAALGIAIQLDDPRQMIVEKIALARQRSLCLDGDFIGRRAVARTASQAAWKQAKQQRDFSLFAPNLAVIINIVREQAQRLCGGQACTDDLYTALLGDYEPGMNTEALRQTFGEVRDWLVPKRAAILANQPADRQDRFPGFYPLERQQRLVRTALRTMGFDFTQGSLTFTEHPFMATVRPHDQRVTTHLFPDHLEAGLFATIHEGGHALFEQGVDPLLHWIGVPGFAISLGLHESQSRLWENVIGRSRSFWDHFLPIAASHFEQLEALTPADAVAMVNRVRPGKIRIYADEVSYNLHILIRFELELALLSGELPVEDLPAAFADKMEQYLGVRPANDAEGVLQDMHWSIGSFGYFPTYTLGNLAAAQLFSAFIEDPDQRQDLDPYRYPELLGWLRTRVHLFGQVQTLDRILSEATGHALNPRHWFSYIDRKFPT